jgi:hypothetical protein
MQNQLADYQQQSKVKAFQPVCHPLLNLLKNCANDAYEGLPYVSRISYRIHESRSRQIPTTYIYLPPRFKYSLSRVQGFPQEAMPRGYYGQLEIPDVRDSFHMPM